MLIPHQFDQTNHRYLVEGEYVLSTSAVIQLNGLSDVSSVPKNNLAHAGSRGTLVHEAIYVHELGGNWEKALNTSVDALADEDKPFGRQLLMDEARERMGFYFSWRKEHDVKLVGKMEQSRVYRHVGTEQCIGATPDFPCLIDGEVYIIDTKTCHKAYGEKQKQLFLKWGLQLESYKECLESEEAFVSAMHKAGKTQINRAILHLHPECGKNGTKGEQSGYEFHAFTGDDSFIWDSAIRMAKVKLASGYKIGGSE